MYFDFKPNNPSWLKAGEQANSGGIYASCYNTLVNCLSAANNIYDLKVVEVSEMVDGMDYSEYWKVNQDEMIFITPTTVSYKVFSGRIKGNEIGLGFTDGTSNFTVYNGNNSDYTFLSSTLYGSNVGTAASATNSIEFYKNKIIGLTTDASKSGIIAEESTAQLYFKVANAVQNLEILNAGEVLEALANKADKDSDLFDGQWVFNQIELTQSTAANQVLDLSNYLPDDCYNYEVMLSCHSYTSGTEYSRWIYTDIMPCNVGPWRDLWCSANSRNSTNSFTVPVGTGRVVYFSSSGMSSMEIFAKGYRRLGVTR